MKVVRLEHFGPKLLATTLDEISGLVFEHGIVIRDGDELVIAESFGESNVSQVGIPLLAVFANDERVVNL
jgi:hypothetical protein